MAVNLCWFPLWRWNRQLPYQAITTYHVANPSLNLNFDHTQTRLELHFDPQSFPAIHEDVCNDACHPCSHNNACSNHYLSPRVLPSCIHTAGGRGNCTASFACGQWSFLYIQFHASADYVLLLCVCLSLSKINYDWFGTLRHWSLMHKIL